MIVLGLTGSIGMGKSTAARMLRILGVPVFDSDRAVHHALAKGKAMEEVAATFPECWDKKKRMIDRKRLGAVVFNDAQKRKVLEAILHPVVWGGQKKFIAVMERQRRSVVGLDIPLLFETGAQSRVDYTICVSAPFAIQRRRVLSRPGMDEEKFERILQSQMSDSEKRALADFVVQTERGYIHSFCQLWQIIATVKRAGKKQAVSGDANLNESQREKRKDDA